MGSRGSKDAGRRVAARADIIPGVVHGKLIELNRDPGIPDGQEVDVIVRPRRVPVPREGGGPKGRATAAGMLAHLPPEVDDELREIIRERKLDRYRDLPG
jgi:hypothetical protein